MKQICSYSIHAHPVGHLASWWAFDYVEEDFSLPGVGRGENL